MRIDVNIPDNILVGKRRKISLAEFLEVMKGKIRGILIRS
jgi:hypothetical protein